MTKQKQPPLVLRHERYYKDICLMAVPLLGMAWFYYGLRPVLMGAVAFVLGSLCDRLVCLLRRRPHLPQDYSSECFALLIALLLPPACSWYVLVAAVLAGVLVGKEVFGGYGSYPFHPAAVGFAVAAVSWPEEVFRYVAPGTKLPLWDASGVATTRSISEVLQNGGLPSVSGLEMVVGNYAGAIGTTALLVILACALYLLVRRDIGLYAPLGYLAACAAIAFVFPRQTVLAGTSLFATLGPRLNLVRYELMSGGLLFGAVFLVNEPFTTPRQHRGGRFLYGILLGAMTMGFRYYGAYSSSICFALLAINGISEWLDGMIDPLYAGLGALYRRLRRNTRKEGGANAS